MKYLLPIFFLLCLSAGAVVNITSLPYTVSTSNETYTINGSKLSSATDGIGFAANVHDVVIDLQGDTIEFGTDGSANRRGIYLQSGGNYNITVNNGYIIHGAPDTTKTNTYPEIFARAARIGSDVHDITFDSVYFLVYGRNSQIYYQGGADVYNVTFSYCKFVDSMRSFKSRSDWASNSMMYLTALDKATSLTGFNWHLKMYECSTLACHWNNLHIGGDSTVAFVYDNYFFLDARNDFDSASYGTAAQCYAIAVRDMEPGTTAGRVKIYNNTIRVGEDHYGGRGIFMSQVFGFNNDYEDSCIYIYNNDIITHQCNDEEDWTNNSLILRDDWGHVWVRQNQVTTIADTSHTLTGFGPGACAAFRLTAEPTRTCGDLRVEGNKFTAYLRQPGYTQHGSTGPLASCFIFDSWDGWENDIVFKHDTFVTNSCAIKWGFVNGHGGNRHTFDSCHFDYYEYGGVNNPTSDVFTFYAGDAASTTNHAQENKAIDCSFSGLSDTSIYMADSETSDSLSFGLAVRLKVCAEGQSNIGLPNAIITVTNDYGQSFYDTTDANGNASVEVNYWWECNTFVGVGDSTAFNDFIITANWHGITAVDTYTVAWNAKNDTVVVPLNQTYKSTADSIVIGVKIYTIDSTTSAMWDGVGIPRYKIAPLSGAGDLVLTTDGWPNVTGADTTLYKTYNLDSTGVFQSRRVIPWGTDATHDHISVYNDTLYIMHMQNPSEAIIYTYDATGNLGAPIWSYNCQTDASYFNLFDSLYVMGTLRLPETDSMVGISRGGGGTLAFSWVSTDKGQTWDTVGHVANLWAYRFGVISYNNSATAIVDSSDKSIQWWNYNRTSGSWVKNGENALDGYGDFYRAFSGNRIKDTFQFVISTLDKTIDTMLWGWKTNGQSSWTEGKFELSAFPALTVEYNTLEAIDSTDRMVVFYTKASYQHADSIVRYMRYWCWSDSNWSDEYRISPVEHVGGYKLYGAQIVPESHGDIAYVAYPYISGGKYYGALARVIFDTLTATQQQQEQSGRNRFFRGIRK